MIINYLIRSLSLTAEYSIIDELLPDNFFLDQKLLRNHRLKGPLIELEIGTKIWKQEALKKSYMYHKEYSTDQNAN